MEKEQQYEDATSAWISETVVFEQLRAKRQEEFFPPRSRYQSGGSAPSNGGPATVPLVTKRKSGAFQRLAAFFRL